MKGQEPTLKTSRESSRSKTRLWQRAVKLSKYMRTVPIQALMVFLAFLFVGPIAWMLLNSLKSNYEFFQSIWSFPVPLTLAAYSRAWLKTGMALAFVNTLWMTSVSVLLVLILGVAASYALARLKFPGRPQLLYAFSFGMFVPRFLAIIPLYMLLNRWGLLGFPGVIIAFVVFELPFTVFILAAYMKTLPQELHEAAILDGCSEFEAFRHVMLPLAQGGIITVGVIEAIAIWNDYLFPLILLPDPSKSTLALAIAKLMYKNMQNMDMTGLFAAFVIAAIPSLVVYAIFQSRLAEGLTMGALKG
mgnify:CR=1 FL=1